MHAHAHGNNVTYYYNIMLTNDYCYNDTMLQHKNILMVLVMGNGSAPKS